MKGNFVSAKLTCLGAICSVIFFTGCAVDSGPSYANSNTINALSEKPDAGFANRYWKLVKLNGNPAELGTGQKQLHLISGKSDNLVHGFSGCNRFTASYTLTGDQLVFKQMASTRMACLNDNNPETAFLQALTNVRRFAIKADGLTLYDDQNQVVLEFVAVYLR